RWCSLTSSAHASSSRTAHRWISEASRPPTSVQVIARTGFTESSPPMVAPPCWNIRFRALAKVPRPATMDGVKRILAGILLLAVAAAGVYGYTATRREQAYRQYLASGDAALARDNAFAAIEAFSGAIALKPDAMIGYLKRGQTYRRRGEIAAA